MLSARGTTALLLSPSIAVVGACNASINAVRLAQTLLEQLAGNGYVVVSGLARGIDTAAHNGALALGTGVVIASGIDFQYPPEDGDLHDAIAGSGLLLAEMPPGTRPTPRHFPIRNRIIGSLALGVLVIEAAMRSGSLISAREVGERGSEVMAVPGSPLDGRTEGCIHLNREGATLVRDIDDILECPSRPPVASLPTAKE